MSAVTSTVMNLRELLDATERAVGQGNLADGGKLLEMAYQAAPDNADVLSACGIHALHSGRAHEGRVLLERAVALVPTNPRFLLNLACTLRALNEQSAEMEALHQALTLDPYYYLANFQKASLLELQGQKKAAANVFQAALSSIPPGSQIPVMVQSMVEHARQAVFDNLDDLDNWLQVQTRQVRAKHAGVALDRVDDCLSALVGKKRIFVQQPTMMHFPRLPAIQFYDRAGFPWLTDVEVATNDIRDELAVLLSQLADFSPYVTHPAGAPLNQWKELNHSRRWSALFVYKDGELMTDNMARCPKTVAALAHAPQVYIPERGPTAFFSRLEPMTRIPPHTGSTNTRLTVHIPLVVPPNCGFRVGSEIREWEVGKALIFDDTIEHEAWNDSSEPRVVLIFDIWNPLLTDAEKELISVATASIAQFSAKA